MKQYKNKTLFLVTVTVLLGLHCADKEPPAVIINQPSDGAYVDKMVLIIADAIDNKAVDSMALYIDNSFVAGSSNSQLYYLWNTESIPHNSSHYICAQAYDNSSNLGNSDTIEVKVTHPGTIKWCYPTEGCKSYCPAIGIDGTIYIAFQHQLGGGTLFAINPDDGSIKWWTSAGGYSEVTPVIGPEGTIYISLSYGPGAGMIIAINPDGSEKWRIPNINPLGVPAVSTDGTLYIGIDSSLYAIAPNGTIKWRYRTNGLIYSAPAIGSDGRIHFYSRDGFLYVLNADSTLKWRYPIYCSSALAIGSNNTIYVVSNQCNLHALNPDGSLKWTYNLYATSNPIIGFEEIIYIGGSPGNSEYYLYALNPNGTLRWKYKTNAEVNTTPALAADGTIYFGADGLYALNSDGTLKWHALDLCTHITSPTIGMDGSIFLEINNYLCAINGTSPLAHTFWPKFQCNLRNSGQAWSN
ncbi:MAG: PQQ-binding-like beta-propeller repeat protein [candidate division WOR-3 bacterium]